MRKLLLLKGFFVFVDVHGFSTMINIDDHSLDRNEHLCRLGCGFEDEFFLRIVP